MAHPLKLRGILLGLILLEGTAPGCDGASSENDGVWRSCKPAPVRLALDAPEPCEFDGVCIYSAPHALDGYDECTSTSCRCKAGQLLCASSVSGCSEKRTACPLGIAEGDACTMSTDASGKPSNHECLFGSDPGGKVASHSCACDMPGPFWRCVPL